MATAEELLVSLNENDNIIIDENRFIKVPEKLKRIAVQYDHNIETVTFNGPRYWDDHDLSDMEFYINYMRADGEIGSYIVENVGAGSNFVDFQWTISEHVSAVKGKLSFLVCAKETDADGNILYHWNSELNTDLYVSAGLETRETILMEHPDIITQLLSAIDRAESIVSPSVTLATTSEGYRMTVTDSNGSKTYTIKHGATGPQGPTGAKGDKGDKGSTGATGPQGTSITSIARTSGTGASGSTDTYTITLSDGSTSEFKVYNGKDGSGAGDMVSTVYDPQNKQTDIFKYVDDKLCNPNLLRNWYFANPVNQRGDTTYSAPGYAIDGWTLGTSLLSVNIEGDGLRIEKIATGSFAFMYQYLSDLPEGKYTFSALITNAQGAGGSIFVYKTNTGADFTSKNRLGSIVTIENGVATCTFDYKYDEALPRLALVVGFRDNAGLNSSCKVIAAKLESGSTQTLARQDGVDASGMPIWALNEIPDYHEELLKCIQSTADASDEYANKVIYHTGNKPTSEEIGLSVAKDLYTLAASCSVAYDGTTQNTPGNGSEKVTDYTSGICHVFVGTTYRTLVCVSGNGHIYTNRYDGSTWSGWKKLYSEHNKPTAADVGAAVATTHNVQTYYTLNQIGLTFGAETMADRTTYQNPV